MKMTAKLVLAAAIGASVGVVCAWGDDDAAYSANAVGVVKFEIPADNGLTCVNLPLYPMLGTNTHHEATRWFGPETDVAKQLPNGTIVYFWDGTGWQSSAKGSRGWSKDGASKYLGLDEAFFIKGLSGAETMKVSLLGELPVDDDMRFTVPGDGTSLNPYGVSTYPVSGKWAQSGLSSNLPSGTVVYFWDGTGWQSSA